MILDTVKGVIALVLVILLAVAGFIGWQRWREIQRERHVVAEADAKREGGVVAEVRESLVDSRRQLDVALDGGRSVLAAAPIRRPVASRAMPPERVLDTLRADSLRGIIREQHGELDSLRAWGDSIEGRLAVARDTLAHVIAAAERYRLYADSTIHVQARQIVAMQIVIDTPKPRRRWGIGGATGYCSVYQKADRHVEPAGQQGIRHGPGACVGLSFTF